MKCVLHETWDVTENPYSLSHTDGITERQKSVSNQNTVFSRAYMFSVWAVSLHNNVVLCCVVLSWFVLCCTCLQAGAAGRLMSSVIGLQAVVQRLLGRDCLFVHTAQWAPKQPITGSLSTDMQPTKASPNNMLTAQGLERGLWNRGQSNSTHSGHFPLSSRKGKRR